MGNNRVGNRNANGGVLEGGASVDAEILQLFDDLDAELEKRLENLRQNPRLSDCAM
jgi:hypothetical protein